MQDFLLLMIQVKPIRNRIQTDTLKAEEKWDILNHKILRMGPSDKPKVVIDEWMDGDDDDDDDDSILSKIRES